MHQRRYAVGAELAGDGQISVRVWAPGRDHVAVVVDGVATVLEPDGDGYSAATVAGHAGSRYGFRLDDDPKTYPDPASRFQPEGPHGLSEVIEPSSYAWRDDRWPGISMKGQVLYELHVGTFSPAGTWAGAAEQLDRLAALGITAIQMMPVAEFAGSFGWGYDGVGWLAPTRLYGRPDDLRAFVDAAHARGLAVVLDAVYNHLGPDGNYLLSYTRRYFSDRYANEWGDALNFDGQDAAPVRELVLASVDHWIREYHFDGFRLDATQQIFDSSAEHLLTALVRRARAAAGTRQIVVIAENETQHAQLLRPVDQGGSDVDALYNDDFHHTARVALTGVREAYYTDFGGTVQELLSAAKHGFLFQGQRFGWQNQTRGTPALDRPLRQFVQFLENHDQVANSAAGRRLSELCAPSQLRALTALLLLSPATPLLFQGQELGSTSPFVYFAHHEGELGANVRKGRLGFLGQFARYRTPAVVTRQPDPTARSTFEMCKLRMESTERAQQFWNLHHDLLRLRREDLTIALQGEGGLDGAAVGAQAFVLRFFGAPSDDRLLVVNMGTDLDLATCGEPLVAPPAGASWAVAWSSEDPAYGGSGTPAWQGTSWPIPGHAAVLLTPNHQSHDRPSQ